MMPTKKTSTDDPKPFRPYTVAETAEMLDTSEKTVRRLINQGMLRSHKGGRSVRIALMDLVDYLSPAA